MFIIKQSETFKSPVTVVLAGENGGSTKNTFTAIFKRLSLEEVDALQKEVNAGLSDPEFARRVMVGWGDDVRTEAGGEPVPFSDVTFSQMLEVVGAAAAIVTAWSEGMAGGAKRKN